MNTTKQYFRATWPYYSIHSFLSFLKWFFFIVWQKFYSKWKKVLQNWWIDSSITQSISWCDSKYNRQYQNHFTFTRVFFGENCVCSFGFLSGAESFMLDIPGKTTPWITSICSTILEELDVTSSLTTQCQNVYTFWWETFCKWRINQLPLPGS